MEELFDDSDWIDGEYELWIRLGPCPAERLRAAVARLWAHPALAGPYVRREDDPEAYAPADPREAFDERLYGRATLPDGAQVTCRSDVLRDLESFDDPHGDEHDVLFGLPIRGLEAVWPQVAGIFERDAAAADHRWRAPLDDWLAELAHAVFEELPFRAAAVGIEVYALQDLADDTLRRRRGGKLPAKRATGLLLPDGGRLAWCPATDYTWRGSRPRRMLGGLRTVARVLLPRPPRLLRRRRDD